MNIHLSFQYDAEIVFLEGKEKEKQRQLDHLSREIIAFTNLSKSNQEQVGFLFVCIDR